MKKLLTILLLLCASTAQSAIIELNLYASGDGLITRDTDSGLEWLDISAAAGISTMQLGAHALSSTYSFRIATFEELEDLYVSAGATSAYGVITNASSAASNLANSHGWTDTGPYAFLEEDGIPFASSPSPDLIAGMIFYGGILTSTVIPMAAYQTNFDSFPQDYSLVLVRDLTAVPAPAPLWLFISGLLGLIHISKRGRSIHP